MDPPLLRLIIFLETYHIVTQSKRNLFGVKPGDIFLTLGPPSALTVAYCLLPKKKHRCRCFFAISTSESLKIFNFLLVNFKFGHHLDLKVDLAKELKGCK